MEQGYKLLKQNGIFQFILSNKFARAKYGEALRLFLLQKTTLTHFIDFSELAVFDEATVDACILGFQKKKSSENILLACSIQKENFKPASFAKNIPTPNFSQNQLTEDAWVIASPQEIQLKAKIENIGTPLKDWDLKINSGIKTGYNDAFIIDQTKRDELLAADPKSAEIIKPILKGRDIKAYQHRWTGLYMITTFPALKILTIIQKTAFKLWQRYFANWKNSTRRNLKQQATNGLKPKQLYLKTQDSDNFSGFWVCCYFCY